MTDPVLDVLDDLTTVIGKVGADQFDRPTPCPDYDVATLRRHILGWLPVFATALTDPDGSDRPDPNAHQAPDDAGRAASEVADSRDRIAAALDAGVQQRGVRLLGGELPGQAVVAMLTGEMLAHGWDLARATGQPWQPSEQACQAATSGMSGMLSPEYRGPGKPFGLEVAVPDDASALDRLLGFSGRDPNWTPPQ
jgi:uncharacterized protein (TIGR03086 family)